MMTTSEINGEKEAGMSKEETVCKEGFDAAWKTNAIIGLLGLDEETAEALWGVAFMAGLHAGNAVRAAQPEEIRFAELRNA
jgi:hypothetical protein